MKRAIKIGCAAAFLLLCAALLLFLHQFTRAESSAQYLEWDFAAVVSGESEGTERPFDPLEPLPELEKGEYYRLSTTLPERQAELRLLFEISGLELAVQMDGKTLLCLAADAAAEGLAQGQAQISLPAGGGETLVMDVRPVGAGPGLFPPLLRLMDDAYSTASDIAYANLTAIPAGAAALALVLVWGLFLLSVTLGRPDWSLLPLLLAAMGLTVYRLSQSTGAYFLPRPLLDICTWPGLGLLTVLALLAYLAINRRRSFWRSFGWITLWSAAALLAAFLFSLSGDGYLAEYLCTAVSDLVHHGIYDGLAYWLTQWLTLVCVLLSALDLVRSIIQSQAQARAAQVKYRLTLENYQQAADKNRQTAALRHEWNNQLVALHLLLQKGDLAGLEQKLESLERDLGRLSTQNYTEQPAINAILQNAAYQAEKLGVDFRCQVLVPGELKVDEGDLCALLLNMLDNALEAAAKVAPPRSREVHCKLKLTQGFLAVWCQNTYTGPLRTDEAGNLLTTKEETGSHGFGLAQMREIAVKYRSVLDIDYDGEHFTVQTALKVQ